MLGVAERHLEDVGVLDQRDRGPVVAGEEAERPDRDAGPEDRHHEGGDENG
jgi:hypothetical protein